MITFVFWLALLGSLGGSVVKNQLGSAGDMGSIRGSGRSPRRRNGNPLQYYFQGNPMDIGTCGLQSMVLQRVRHNWACAHDAYWKQTRFWYYIDLWSSEKQTKLLKPKQINKHYSPNLSLVFCKMGIVTACKVVVREETIWWSKKIQAHFFLWKYQNQS